MISKRWKKVEFAGCVVLCDEVSARCGLTVVMRERLRAVVICCP